MLLSRLFFILIVFSFNATAQISKEEVKQVFLDANAGNYKAQNYLGSMYANGVGVDKNYQYAADWYRKSSDQGYADASRRLGYLYRNGMGVQRDYAEARILFEKALKKAPNNVDVQIAMGIIYYGGEGVEQSYIKAAEWFKKPAELNNKLAIKWLKSTNKRIAQGKQPKNLLIKAKLGDVNAQYELASYYHSNDVLNYKEAFKWYSLAAEQDDVRSIEAIGRLFYYGSGVAKSHKTARTWFLRAKKMGSQRVQGYLALTGREITIRLKGDFHKPRRSKSPSDSDGLVVLGGIGLAVLYIILVGWHGYFPKLSVAISPISLYLFVVYYESWVQSTCSGECNIRIDVFIAYPLLFGVVIVGLANLVRIEDKY